MIRKFKNSMYIFLTFLLTLVVFSGCKEDTAGPKKTPLRPVSGLQAYSIDSASVWISWSTAADIGLAGSYQLTVTGPGFDTTMRIPKDTTSKIITHLTEGVIYTFSVIVKAPENSDSYSDSPPASIQWSPATRFTTIDRIHEIKSANGDRSGLQFYDAVTKAPRRRSIRDTDAQTKIDVLLDTIRTGPYTGSVILESAHLNPLLPETLQARRTRFSTISIDVDSFNLNIGRASPPPLESYTLDYVTISGVMTKHKIFYAVTHDTNFVRILIKRHHDQHTLLFGLAPNRYIEINLSYQKVRSVPFAKTK